MNRVNLHEKYDYPELGAIREFAVLRNKNNGFDGAVYFIKNGEPQLAILEAKAWSSNKVQAGHLTAFGFGANLGTLLQNKDVLEASIRSAKLATDIETKLLRKLAANQFEVHLYGINDGKFQTGWNAATIQAAFSSLSQDIKVVIKNISPPG